MFKAHSVYAMVRSVASLDIHDTSRQTCTPSDVSIPCSKRRTHHSSAIRLHGTVRDDGTRRSTSAVIIFALATPNLPGR